ncbi:MFS transporter [Mycobacterium heidelbergense]|uniref:Multidrug efflux pump Tap n=1 Tax=Mycobacterium heidelbergense TaxID=53376 RepID=A0A1X0DR51_MYCHE|nr:MFS transporter [Mycobacterium heidelbergense]MCV7053407.1 MFS transporter [Mycobacterium heidelbergense]ORA74817.1 MFS transporter [Mycobacterium heidelbergense]BBZ51550.1 putative multidrug-efflux transporter [Mycobacterium heidelbergense]
MRNGSRGPVFLILFAALTGCAGTGISIVAFPWLVLQRHGRAGEAAIVAAAMTLPLVGSTLVAGTAVDFFGRRRVSLVSDALSGTAVAAVPLIAWWLGGDALNLAVLAALAFFAASFDPAGMTARQSMLPEAAARAGWSLDRTNSVYEAILNLAYIVGPGIGGLMIATVGGVNTMWVTAGCFGLSFLAIGALRLEGTGKPHHATRPDGLVSGVAEGMRFVWNLRVLRTLGVIDLVVTALYLPMESVLFPKYFSDRHQPAQLGWALMALGVGGVAGALGYAVLSKRMRRRTAVLTATLTFGAATAGIAFLPPLPVILVLCAVTGLVYGPIQPIYNYVMQTRAPHHLRGRVVGVMTGLTFAAGPLGLLVAGPLADAVGLKVTFLALALPILSVGAIAARLPSLRELDRAPEFAVDAAP